VLGRIAANAERVWSVLLQKIQSRFQHPTDLRETTKIAELLFLLVSRRRRRIRLQARVTCAGPCEHFQERGNKSRRVYDSHGMHALQGNNNTTPRKKPVIAYPLQLCRSQSAIRAFKNVLSWKPNTCVPLDFCFAPRVNSASTPRIFALAPAAPPKRQTPNLRNTLWLHVRLQSRAPWCAFCTGRLTTSAMHDQALHTWKFTDFFEGPCERDLLRKRRRSVRDRERSLKQRYCVYY